MMQTPYPPEVDIPFAIHITNNKRRPCGEKINRRAAFIETLYEKKKSRAMSRILTLWGRSFCIFCQ